MFLPIFENIFRNTSQRIIVVNLVIRKLLRIRYIYISMLVLLHYVASYVFMYVYMYVAALLILLGHIKSLGTTFTSSSMTLKMHCFLSMLHVCLYNYIAIYLKEVICLTTLAS